VILFGRSSKGCGSDRGSCSVAGGRRRLGSDDGSSGPSACHEGDGIRDDVRDESEESKEWNGSVRYEVSYHGRGVYSELEM
jgi:hypothetical protein